MRQLHNQKSKTKKIIILIAILVALAAVAGYFAWKQIDSKNTGSTQPDNSGIKYEPATPQEKKETEQHKDDLVKDRERAEQEAKNPPASGKRAVTPVITLAQFSGNSATIQAYVPGIFEEGGTCTATLKNGSNSFSRQSSAFANATTTDCQHITIPRSDFPATGIWSVSVTYSSPKAEGTSTQQSTLEVK